MYYVKSKDFTILYINIYRIQKERAEREREAKKQ